MCRELKEASYLAKRVPAFLVKRRERLVKVGGFIAGEHGDLFVVHFPLR